MSLKEIISKASIANVVAGIVVVAGLIYAFYTSNQELMKTITLVGLGYLFGRKTASD